MGTRSFFKQLLNFLSGGRLFSSNNIEEQIQHLIDVGEEAGQLSEHEGNMLQGILELRDTLAREIMVPRTEITGIRLDTPLDQIIDLISEKGHSRYPVFEEDVDHISGILHVKDLISLWKPDTQDMDLKALLRPCRFIPDNKHISDILRDFQNESFHMAIVTDEYGGTSGLLTIEDILEEIVGDIQDEYDKEETLIEQIDQQTFVVDARVDIEDLEEILQIDFPEGTYESVGGFIIHLVARVPGVGEVITFDNLEFVIEEADERKIERIRVHRSEPQVTVSNVD